MKRYSELLKLHTFDERFKYLMLKGRVGEDTFGFDRYLNQKFYTSSEWKRIRRQIIVRDDGCDLGIKDCPIFGKIFIHHMNPITADDICHNSNDLLLNPEYLICVSKSTHDAIHYGDEDYLYFKKPVERFPNDTCPWKGE